MSGKGIDRHLFALYIVCRGQGYVSYVYYISILLLALPYGPVGILVLTNQTNITCQYNACTS